MLNDRSHYRTGKVGCMEGRSRITINPFEARGG